MSSGSSQVDVLVSRLIDLCREEEESFLAAAKEVPVPHLRSLLQSFARQREGFGRTLRGFLPPPGPETERVMQRLELLHQGWVDFHLARAAGDINVILAECEQEERHVLASYQRALAASLPPELSSALARHCEEVQSTCQQVLLLRKQPSLPLLTTEATDSALPAVMAG